MSYLRGLGRVLVRTIGLLTQIFAIIIKGWGCGVGQRHEWQKHLALRFRSNRSHVSDGVQSLREWQKQLLRALPAELSCVPPATRALIHIL
jgi:hypothetical protein